MRRRREVKSSGERGENGYERNGEVKKEEQEDEK